jgi:sphingosine kinase
MDLQIIQDSDGHEYLSFLCLSYGSISNIDLDSEVLRCMGETRFTLYALLEVMAYNQYECDVWVYQKPTSDEEEGKGEEKEEGKEEGEANDISTFRQPSVFDSLENEEGWSLLKKDGQFNFLWILNTSHSSATVYSSPGSRLDDGKLRLVFLEGDSRCALFNILLDLETGEFINNPSIKVYEVDGFRIEERNKTNKQLHDYGKFSLDGEHILRVSQENSNSPGNTLSTYRQDITQQRSSSLDEPLMKNETNSSEHRTVQGIIAPKTLKVMSLSTFNIN